MATRIQYQLNGLLLGVKNRASPSISPVQLKYNWPSTKDRQSLPYTMADSQRPRKSSGLNPEAPIFIPAALRANTQDATDEEPMLQQEFEYKTVTPVQSPLEGADHVVDSLPFPELHEHLLNYDASSALPASFGNTKLHDVSSQMNVPVPPKAGLSAVEALRQSLQVLPPQKTHDYGVIGDKPVSTPATQLTQASHSAEKHVQEPRDALMQLALHQSITPAELAKILKGDSAAVGMPIPSRPTIEAPARGNESRVGGDISRDMGMARLQASLPLSIREEEESLSRGDSKVPASGLPETPTKECPIRNRGVTFSNVLVRAQRPKRRSLNPNFKRTDQGPNVSVADVYPEDSPHHQASKEKTLKVDVSEQWLTPAEAEGRRQGATAPPAPILSGAWRQGPPIQRSSRRAGAQDGSPVLRRGCGASAQDQEAAAFQRQIEEHNQRMVQATMPNPDLPASQLLSTEQAAQAYKEHLAARFSWIQEQQQQLPGRQDQRPMLLPEELVSTEQRPFQSRNERLLTRPEHATQQHNPTRVRAEPMLQQPAHENVQGQLTLVSLETLCNHPAVANHPLFKSIDINALHEAEQNAPPSPPMSAVVSLGRYDPLQCERRRLSPSQLDGSRYGVKIAIGTEWNPPVPK